MHTQFGVPLAKIVTVLRDRFGLTVTPGGLAQGTSSDGAAGDPDLRGPL